jgi:hypothetical protein
MKKPRRQADSLSHSLKDRPPPSGDIRTELREIAKIVERAVGKGRGFAIFLAAGGQINYISNANREDVVTTLEEWLEKTAGRGKGRVETSTQIDTRLELERRCAFIGKGFAEATSVALFLFDFGDGGNLAYFSNIPELREAVERWVTSERSRS